MGMPASRVEYYDLFMSLVVVLRLDSRDLHPKLLIFEDLLLKTKYQYSIEKPQKKYSTP
jgi:hypothetical protein